jgi:subtilase family serine protease
MSRTSSRARHRAPRLIHSHRSRRAGAIAAAAAAAAVAASGATLALADSAGAARSPASTGATLLSQLGPTAALAGSLPSIGAGVWTGAAPAATGARALVALQHRNESGLLSLISQVSNPHSRHYEDYLSPTKFDARFAPTTKTVGAVETYLKRFGLTISSVPTNRAYVYVTGNVGEMTRAFDTTIDTYMRDGVPYVSARTQLSIPAALSGVITGVTGLNTGDIATPNIATSGSSSPFSATALSSAANTSTCVNTAPATPTMTTQSDPTETPPDAAYVNAAPFSTSFSSCAATQAPSYDGSALGDIVQGYTPQQVEGAYGVSDAIADGLDGAGQTVAVVDAYSSPTMTADADEWSANMGLPKPILTINDNVAERSQPDGPTVPTDVPVVGGVAAPLQPSGWFGEESLDVEAVHAMAPDAAVIVQSALSPENVDFHMAQNSLVEADQAEEISNSYGASGSGGDSTDATSDGYWQQAAAEGIGVEFSSGDDGDNTGGGATDADAGVDTDPNSPYVTAVGGTALAVGSQDNYEWETYWNDQTATLTNGAWGTLSYDGGGGGGTSEVYAEPAWQKGVVPTSIADFWQGNANAASASDTIPGRAVPDVSMLADPNTGFLMGDTQDFDTETDPLSEPIAATDKDAYDQYRIGGTSLSSPLFAGMMALANQANGKPLGFVDPALYGLYSSNATAFHDPDVTSPVAGIVRTNYNDDTGLAGDTSANTTTVLRTFDDTNGVVKELPGYDDSTGLGSPNGLTFLCGLAPNSSLLQSIHGAPCYTETTSGGSTTVSTTTTTPGSTTTTPGSNTTTPGGTTTTPGGTVTTPRTITVVKKTTTVEKTKVCAAPKRLSFVQHPAYPVRETKAVVAINGKQVRTVVGKRIVDVLVTRPKATKFTLTLVATLSTNAVIKHTYHYNGCKFTGTTKTLRAGVK